MDEHIQPTPSPTLTSPASKKRHTAMYIVIVVIVLLLAGAGWLAWQWKTTYDQNAKTTSQNTQLQNQVSDLKKQLANAQKTTAQPTNTVPCVASFPQSLKDNIHDALTSKNTAALEGYMASTVVVVYAASEKGGPETAAAAVSDLNYLNTNATSPWDFALPDATLNTYKAHFYAQYFMGTTLTGRSANKMVAAFTLDCNGKINRIFVSAAEDILTVD